MTVRWDIAQSHCLTLFYRQVLDFFSVHGNSSFFCLSVSNDHFFQFLLAVSIYTGNTEDLSCMYLDADSLLGALVQTHIFKFQDYRTMRVASSFSFVSQVSQLNTTFPFRITVIRSDKDMVSFNLWVMKIMVFPFFFNWRRILNSSSTS